MFESGIVGVWAAFKSRHWLNSERFQSLLKFNESNTPDSINFDTLPVGESGLTSTYNPSVNITKSTRVSVKALIALSRFPDSEWKNTCLFRSVAHCLILRKYGIKAKVCLGVRKSHSVKESVNAHAWVEVFDVNGRDNIKIGYDISEAEYRSLRSTVLDG